MGRHRDEQAAAASGTENSGLVVLCVIAVLALVLIGFGVRGLVYSDDASADDEGTDSAQQTTGSTDPGDEGQTALTNMGEDELEDAECKAAGPSDIEAVTFTRAA